MINLVYVNPQREAHFWSEKTFQWMNAWWQCSQLHSATSANDTRDNPHPLHVKQQTPTTVKSFASQMGYSRSYLSRKLTQQWSESPGVVFRLVRLQQAADLLRTTQLSIGEIAKRVGYRATAQFGRAFMVKYKQTPRDYRHTHR